MNHAAYKNWPQNAAASETTISAFTLKDLRALREKVLADSPYKPQDEIRWGYPDDEMLRELMQAAIKETRNGH